MNILYPELWKYITNFLNVVSIAVLRHVCRDINTIITPKLITSNNIVSDAILLGFTSVAKFLIETKYKINKLTVNSAVERGNFEILNICIEKGHKLTFNHFLTSIKSKNRFMISYICLPFLEVDSDKLHLIIEEIAKIDDVNIFKLLIPNRSQNTRKSIMYFVFHNSINIIEDMRFRLGGRVQYEKEIIAWATHLNNIDMIKYCNENDYGREPS